MSNRTKATSIPKKVREEVYARDKGCIICSSTSNLTIAHFISRSKSGMGIKENLVTLCILCTTKWITAKTVLKSKQR
ncbi:MAG: HNH endonuclease [Clostridiaceae bacterium]|nr:HNH endonuclease [Clostridiaceae bacterium]